MQIPKDAIVVQEITDWEFPNHIYILRKDKSKMYGYVKAGTTQVQMFGGPRGFDPARRKFKVVPLPIEGV